MTVIFYNHDLQGPAHSLADQLYHCHLALITSAAILLSYCVHCFFKVLLTLTKPGEHKESPFLVFHVAHLGIDTKVRKYDLCATTYIRKVTLKCLEFKGERLHQSMVHWGFYQPLRMQASYIIIYPTLCPILFPSVFHSLFPSLFPTMIPSLYSVLFLSVFPSVFYSVSSSISLSVFYTFLYCFLTVFHFLSSVQFPTVDFTVVAQRLVVFPGAYCDVFLCLDMEQQLFVTCVETFQYDQS